ncbi:MAG: serine/threonine protein phosphatase PrpC [Planctomycetota bacterium]|jgi:serine/threonine protein phosphatase PrpC
MKTRGFGATDIGTVRETNEDRLFVSDELGLYLVCDGMGGHAAGEIAAQIATDTVVNAVRKGIARSATTKGRAPNHVELQEVLRRAIQGASLAVCAEAMANPERAGMGCTITALQFVAGKAVMAHVGDTRLYLLRDGAVELLSSDHTLAAEMKRRGELTPTEAEHHKYANALTRCIGSQDAVQVDSLVLDVGPDDRFLICSDGLSGYVESLSELASALTDRDPAAIPSELIRVANDRGGQDNITAIAIVMEAADDEMKRLLVVSDESRQDLELLRGLDLFKAMSFVDALRILSYSEIRSCRAGEVVVGLDEPNDRLCLALAGRFEMRSRGESLAVRLRTGDCVGDTALLVPQRRRCVLSALDDGRMLVLSGERFRSLARRRPWLGVRLMAGIAAKLSIELDAAEEMLRETVARGRVRRGWWARLVAAVRG